MLAVVIGGCVARPVTDGRSCGTTAACEMIHPAGISDPSSPDFHGKLLQEGGWNFPQCQICHGSDFAGGTSGKSCLTCHPAGPTSCTTCHALPPTNDAHPAHSPKYACSECHVVPAHWNDPGHLFTSDGKVITQPTITFGPIAKTNAAKPTWDGTKCTNTYCHGDAKPAWNGGASQASCGSCHGIPPADHTSNQCGDCHGLVANNQQQIINAALHVDGKVEVGDGSGGCQACHPNAGLDGAHTSHLQATHELRGPLACGDCHLVPATVTAAGHPDQPIVTPFPPSWSGIASDDGAMPTWNQPAMLCAGTYCHGNGTTLSADAAPNILRAPTWTPGNGAAVCGACHGIPPADGVHTSPMDLTACATCHPTTMNAQGGLIAGGTHIDGVIEHVP
jgi:predicted CxxxxCH...CXXCH cytochrome family protein